MPLIQGKSKKSFEKNVKAEMDAGKPQKQSLAIAFSVQRKNKPKKMAYGGMARDTQEPAVPMKKADDMRLPKEDYMGDKAYGGPDPERKPDDKRLPEDEYMADHFAKGGMADADEHYSSIADAILAKKKHAKAYADGGMVDLEHNSEEEPNQYYGMDEDAAKKEMYDDDQLMDQPEDSNEHGDEIDSDKHDMVDAIRKKIKYKQAG